MKTWPLYLNNEFVTTDKTIPVRNPAAGKIITLRIHRRTG
jgi:hypothetical protein